MSRLRDGRRFSWRYALGELVLITMGIYLAFAVNNWSELRKEDQLEQFYLTKLKADVGRSIDQIHWHRVLIQTHLNGARGLDGLLAQGNQANRDSLKLYLNSFNINPVFKNFDASYQSILLSGDYRILKNDRLRNELDKFFLELMPAVITTEGWYHQRLNQHFFPVKESVYLARSQSFNNIDKLFDPVFRDNVYVFPEYIDQEDRQLKITLEAALALKELIEENQD